MGAGDLEKGKRAALKRRETTSSSESEGPEAPKLNVGVAVGVLVASTGLACERYSSTLGRRVAHGVGTDLTAEALTDSLEAIGESGSVSKEWLGLVLLAVCVPSASSLFACAPYEAFV